jgi:hypothetical protein
MNFKSNFKTTQLTMQADAAVNWQNCIVENLSDDAQAAVSGGRKLNYISWENQPALSWEETLRIYYANPGAFIG